MLWNSFRKFVELLRSSSSQPASEPASLSEPSQAISRLPSLPQQLASSSSGTPISEPEKRNKALRTSQAGIDLIKSHEGLRLEWYLCPANKPTIGYGHVILSGEQHLKAAPITEPQAEAILAQDLVKFERSVLRQVKVVLSQGEFDALVSFAFNIGGTALSKSTLLRKLNAGDREGAANEFGRWVFANKRKLPGLVKRREDEAALFRNGGAVAGDRQ